MSYTAKIRSKGLDGTGVDEDVAQSMYSKMGSATLAIVELEHVERHDKSNGDHMVHLAIGFCEPITDADLEDTVRRLVRSIYHDRKAASGDALPGVDEDRRTTKEIASGLDAQVGPDPDDWDGNPDADSSGDEPSLAGEGADDEAFDVHTFLPGTTDPKSCAVAGCGKGKRAQIHKVES